MSYPKPGQEFKATVRTPQAELTVLWTSPKFKVWRRIQLLKANHEAFMRVSPEKVSAAAEALYDGVVGACDVRIYGVPLDVMDPSLEIKEGTAVTAAQLIEGCADADITVSAAMSVLREVGLSGEEKKGSNSQPESSSTAVASPETGTTTPTPNSDGSEGAELEG